MACDPRDDLILIDANGNAYTESNISDLPYISLWRWNYGSYVSKDTLNQYIYSMRFIATIKTQWEGCINCLSALKGKCSKRDFTWDELYDVQVDQYGKTKDTVEYHMKFDSHGKPELATVTTYFVPAKLYYPSSCCGVPPGPDIPCGPKHVYDESKNPRVRGVSCGFTRTEYTCDMHVGGASMVALTTYYRFDPSNPRPCPPGYIYDPRTGLCIIQCQTSVIENVTSKQQIIEFCNNTHVEIPFTYTAIKDVCNPYVFPVSKTIFFEYYVNGIKDKYRLGYGSDAGVGIYSGPDSITVSENSTVQLEIDTLLEEFTTYHRTLDPSFRAYNMTGMRIEVRWFSDDYRDSGSHYLVINCPTKWAITGVCIDEQKYELMMTDCNYMTCPEPGWARCDKFQMGKYGNNRTKSGIILSGSYVEKVIGSTDVPIPGEPITYPPDCPSDCDACADSVCKPSTKCNNASDCD